MSDLKGMLAVVTGASKGIGFAIAKSFSQQGINVAMLSRKEDVLNTAVDEIRSLQLNLSNSKPKVIGITCDVSDPVSVQNTYKQIEDHFHSNIDILVNNAGSTKDGLLMQLKDADIDSVIDTNLKGVLYMCRSVSKSMFRNNKGRIINIGSVVGLRGNIGQSVYSSSKSALTGLTLSLAKELGRKNITVNCIAPGFIDGTDMTKSMLLTLVRSLTPQKDMTKALKDKYAEEIALRRLGTAEDVAETALFLVRSSYITGQTIVVDGGFRL